jgi:hypothetical protein
MAVALPGQDTVAFFCEWHYLTASKFVSSSGRGCLAILAKDIVAIPMLIHVPTWSILCSEALVELFGCLFLLFGFFAAVLHV